MEAQAQTVTAITAALMETVLAADCMSNTIATIYEETEIVSAMTKTFSKEFNAGNGQLKSLERRTSEFATRAAA